MKNAQELTDKLLRLTDLIAQAEDQLRQMPGARQTDCEVEVEGDKMFYRRPHIHVQREGKEHRLHDLPVVLRLNYAPFIPELLKKAEKFTDRLIPEITEVNARLDQALEGYNEGS